MLVVKTSKKSKEMVIANVGKRRDTKGRNVESIWVHAGLFLSLGDKYIEICFIIVLKLHI